jgi:uncharacterized protein YjbI with pentapeptide repeats
MAMTEKLDPFDVKALEGSLNDSATRVSTIWTSFLVFGLYLVIAAGTVTHRQLFLEDPVKLPVLNIDLPMVGFFFLAPVLFVAFNIYVLLQLLLLSRTAAAYNEAVEHNVKDAAENARIRQRLANTLFAQILAGSPRERKGWLGFLLHTMAWLTLAIAPVLVLLVFQFQFLPYHSQFVTWTLRILIVLDLIVVLVLWSALSHADRDVSLQVILRRWIALPFGVGLVALSWIFLTFPGERHAEWTRYLAGGREKPSDAIGATDCRTVSPISKAFPSFDRLSLPDADVIDHEQLRNIEANTKSDGLRDYEGERTRRVRDRNLDCGHFSNSDLRRVDLTNSSFRGASLGFARLEGALLEGARLQGASLNGARLQGASLNDARLQGASLVSAQLQGAVLDGARLQGALLDRVRLEGASLYGASLQGASLNDARLQGASLVSARLQGVVLDGAQLQGAALNSAKLQGASLVSAQLQGASLNSAKLQGASVIGAQLQGVSLYRTQLQGAYFNESSLEQANVTKAFVWRARNADCQKARVAEIILAEPSKIADFINDSLHDVPGALKQRSIERMRAALMIDPANNDTRAIDRVWTQCAEASRQISEVAFEEQLGLFLRDLVCEARESREAIATGIIRNWITDESQRRAFSTELARALLGEDGKPCEATKNLDEKTKEHLRSFLPTPAVDKESSLPIKHTAQTGTSSRPEPEQVQRGKLKAM